MLDTCSPVGRVICAVAVLTALLSLVLSARLMRYVLRETKRLRDKAELRQRIIEAETSASPTSHERVAVLPPAPRP